MGAKLIEAWKTNKIKKEWKIAFIATFIIGLLVHIYRFTNDIPNHDGIINQYDSQNIIGSGRWFLTVACMFSSYFDLPLIDGIFSLVFISLTMVLIVEIFKMENPVLIVIGGGILVSFPAITDTFLFLYTADGYMIAMFFASIAVYITRMETPGVWRTVIAAILICLACGIYQAYVSFALVLAICYFIFSVLKEKLETKNLFKWIGRQAIIYVAGLALYYVIWQILLVVENVDLNDYLGINELSFSASTIVDAFKGMISSLALAFAGGDIVNRGLNVYCVLNIIFLVMFAVSFVVVLFKQKMFQRKLQLLLVLLAVVAIPFAIFMWYFATTSEDFNYFTRMEQSVSILYIFFAVIVEEFLAVKLKNIVAVLLSVIIVNYGVMANVGYEATTQCYETSYAMTVDIMAQITSLDTDVKKIAVVCERGKVIDEKYYNSCRLFLNSLGTYFIYSTSQMVTFLNDIYLTDYEEATYAEVEALKELEEVQEMGTWPSSDSVEVIDDYIVIKLSEIE